MHKFCETEIQSTQSKVCVIPREGGGLFKYGHPPPPTHLKTLQQFSYPPFCHLKFFWGAIFSGHMAWGKSVLPPDVCTSKVLRMHWAFLRQCRVCRLPSPLVSTKTCPPLFFRLCLFLNPARSCFLMPPKKPTQVLHAEYACQCGTALRNVTNAFWLGAVRDLGQLGRIPTCSEVSTPPPPPLGQQAQRTMI